MKNDGFNRLILNFYQSTVWQEVAVLSIEPCGSLFSGSLFIGEKMMMAVIFLYDTPKIFYSFTFYSFK